MYTWSFQQSGAGDVACCYVPHWPVSWFTHVRLKSNSFAYIFNRNPISSYLQEQNACVYIYMWRICVCMSTWTSLTKSITLYLKISSELYYIYKQRITMHNPRIFMNSHNRLTPQTAARSLARPLAVTHSDTVSRLSASRNDATVGCCGFLRAVDTWGRSRWCAGACPPATVLICCCQKKPCKTSWTLADWLVVGDLGIVMIILDDSVCSRSDVLALST